MKVRWRRIPIFHFLLNSLLHSSRKRFILLLLSVLLLLHILLPVSGQKPVEKQEKPGQNKRKKKYP